MSLRETFSNWFGTSTVDTVIVLWRKWFSFADVSEDGGKGSLLTIEDALNQQQIAVQRIQESIAQQEGIFGQLENARREYERELSQQIRIAQTAQEDDVALLAAEMKLQIEAYIKQTDNNIEKASQSIEGYKQDLRDLQLEIEKLKNSKRFAEMSAKQAETMERMQKLANQMELSAGSSARIKRATEAIDTRKLTAEANRTLTQSSVNAQLKTAGRSAASIDAQEELKRLRGQA